MQYRVAMQDDYGQIAGLYWIYLSEENDILPLEEAEFRARFIVFLKRHIGTDYICWVAEEAGKIISAVYIGILEKMPDLSNEPRWIGYVSHVFTLPTYRNRQIASELMDRVQDWARTHSFEILFALPGVKSVPFFERQAFVEDNRFMEYAFRIHE